MTPRKNTPKCGQEARLSILEEALAQRPEGDTLSGLADLARLSRKRAKEGLDTLLERGNAVGCKVTKGRGNREMEGFRLVG